jgi:hypothetical protein
MKIIRRIFLVFSAFLIVVTALGFGTLGTIEKASAQSGCTAPAIGFGRWRWCGFYYNRFQSSGDFVRPGGLPAYVNTAQEFIDLMGADLGSGNAWRVTGAQFVIHTMIGRFLGLPKTVTGAEFTDWSNRVRSYANISENGTQSFGTNGRIDWSMWWHAPCGIVNTYYQPAHNDVAPYLQSASNSDCEVGSVLDQFVVFRNTAGAEVYMIRRECMNPMGNIDPLSASPPPNFSLTPSIGTNVNGVAGDVAQVGDSVEFRYSVNNSNGAGTTPSTAVNCNTYATVYTGYHADGGPPPGGSPAGPNPGCPRIFPVGNTVITTETIPIASANQTICRTLTVNPATWGGGERTTNEVCVIVANKPYLKLFGGDISAGGGLETAPGTCTSFANAGIMAWNERAAGGYSGAGAQYAAYALQTITDFSTAQGNAGGAPVPVGLSFANTSTNAGLGNFGGSFGSASCIPDFWARRPASVLGLPPNVSSMATGAYGATGTTTITGGNVTSGEKISVYIDGDAYISSNITYPGSWSSTNVPLFELIVRGNLYISGGVTQLDGIYIAQPRSAGVGGRIYTCATSATPITVTNGAFYNSCTNKLTINGAFLATSVEFLRTGGTLSQSTPGETTSSNGAGNSAGEVFNFGPAFWITQPLDTSGRVDNYDAITSLPPVL